MPVSDKNMTRKIAFATFWLVWAVAVSAQTPYTKWTRYDSARRVVGAIEPDPDGSGPNHYPAVRNTFDARGVLTRVEVGELASWQPESVSPASWTGFTVFRQLDYTYDSAGRKLTEQ